MKKARLKQIAALPYRKHGKGVDVLLITSRETKRWIIPKGWRMKGKKDWNAAAREAFEEAGVEGKVPLVVSTFSK
ncbi:MAG: NUDIX domain-containing protein, partial [Aestuariivirga sp.]